ncbi:hypothetical protein G5B37_06270 [Rasiella rasia]|uniref:Uncharacterized protein n=1 Tax=Rasiella rasia TaxID=2744027 RepID=A0A6G6GKY0_9FLAO|nr:hypothetical protein [Rasiella rasia]QIE59177.1 hypothetical protein G5B37_06270 [Rasiella rasia]
MTEANLHHFNLLKEKVATTFLEDNHAPKRISEWKGEAITAFQEDLFSKTKGRISEKSFYTYFKNKPKNLPRIDILNLLSQYAGYANWHQFKDGNVGLVEEKEDKKKKGFPPVLWLAIFIPIATMFIVMMNQKNTFTFCMVDEDQGEVISENIIDIKVLQSGQSPVYTKTDSAGCFTYKTKDEKITFVVQSPYYKTDTVTRSIDANDTKMVKLRVDDYTLMLKYYSTSNFKDIEKRRKQLEQLIAAQAEIYQVYPNNEGIELYSKNDFIQKLTIPTSALKNIQILNKTYENGKIVKLKFIVK